MCGFVLKGTDGTLASPDYAAVVRMHTRKQPGGDGVSSDKQKPPYQNPIQYFVHCLRRGEAPEGPLSPEMSRIGQQIVDSAVLSARLKKTVPLLK
jgi:glucose-fructose oxidoreductase